METKIINILSFFLFVAYVNQTWVIEALYISFIYTFAVKRYSDLKIVNFRVLKIGFHGNTSVARQHYADGLFHFLLKILIQLMWSSKQN